MTDHHRISEEGKKLGRLSASMAEVGRARLAAAGLAGVDFHRLRREMCASCACRNGTVPNGCLQTQLDLLKTVVSGDPFLCHAPKDGRLCAGWVGARAEHVARPMPPQVVEMLGLWEYSPPDDVQ